MTTMMPHQPPNRTMHQLELAASQENTRFSSQPHKRNHLATPLVHRGILAFTVFLMMGLVLSSNSAVAAVANVYLAQAAIGTADGSSCANAKPLTFFQTVGNWGTGTSQIGPGTTVHLCGTISTPLGVKGSGTVGNPITILFEPNAKLSMPTCNGTCLYLSGRSYIVVDGGTNGIIEATNNGPGQGSANNDTGIECGPCPNSEIKNLTIRNLFVISGYDSREYGRGVYLIDGNTNTRIHHCTFHDMYKGVNWQVTTTESGAQIDHNTFYNIGWPIVYGDGQGGVTATNFSIHDNDITNGINWDGGGASGHHLDPIHVWAVQSPASNLIGMQLYNNSIHGHFGTGRTTAGIYIEQTTGSISGMVFNNLLVATAGGPTDEMIGLGNQVNAYNNSVVCSSPSLRSVGIAFGGGRNQVIRNNTILDCYTAVAVNSGSTIKGSDFNNYYGHAFWQYWGANHTTLAAWRSASNADSASTNVNPLLDSDYHPQPGSPILGVGENFTSLGITALNFDKQGIPRSVSGRWDLGAYSLSTQPVSAPLDPPRSISVLVK